VLVCAATVLVVLPFVVERPRLLPVLALGGALAVFLLARPAWVLPVLIGVTYSSIGNSFFGGLPSPIEVGAAAFFVVALWRAVDRPAHARDVFLLLTLLALPLVASALLHPDTLPGLYDLVKRLAFLPIVALCLLTRADVERAVLALVVTGLILGVGAVWSILVGPSQLFPTVGLEGLEAPRAAGPFGEPTFFALSLAVLSPLALSLVVRGGAGRWLGYATTLALTAGVIAAGSRGGLLAILVAVAAFVFVGDWRRLRGAAVAVVVGVVVLIPVFGGQASNSADRGIGGRVTENLISIAMFADHPVTGVGPGGYPELYRDYARYIGNDPRVERYAHSLPLEIAAEQGIVGLVAWLVAMGVVARIVFSSGVWRTPVGKGLVLSIGIFGFESLFQHGSQLRIFYMLIGIALALAWVLGRERDELAEAGA
jgi:O-antigen ligase